jgi:hypothetical protein
MFDPDIVVGIDNGLDGGLCAISTLHGSLVDAAVMPCRERGGKREIDVTEAIRWVAGLESRVLISLEEPLKHAKSSAAMRSMSISFGQLYGAFEARHYTVNPVQVGDWQTVMLGKRGSFACTTKERALEKASKIWPDERWLPSKRHRVAHDGIVDAALIAEYARRLLKIVQ